MTKAKRALVQLGDARRQTRADQDIGVLEGMPVHKFRITGWAN